MKEINNELSKLIITGDGATIQRRSFPKDMKKGYIVKTKKLGELSYNIHENKVKDFGGKRGKTYEMETKVGTFIITEIT